MTKDCTTCFFKTFDKQDAPCVACTGYSRYVTDSEIFWKDTDKKMDKYEPTGAMMAADAIKLTDPWPFPVQSSVDIGNAVLGEASTPLNTQVGGDHYKGLGIQPIEYIHANKLGYCEANIVKYITRWRDKGGKQDLEKCKHYVDLLMQLEGL